MGAIQHVKVQMGLVFFDAELQKATNDRNSLAFKRLHKSKTIKNEKGEEVVVPCHSATGQKIYCVDCNETIEHADTTKGYEYQKGKYLAVDSAVLDSLKVESSGAIICRETVSREEFNRHEDMLTGTLYRLVPPGRDKFPANTFALMHAALGDDVIIGKVSIYGRTQVCAVLADKNSFKMHMLRFPNEVRQAPENALPPIDQNQLAMAKQIVGITKKAVIDLDYRDEVGEKQKQYVDSLVSGIPLEEQAAPAQQIVPDNLNEMLRRTLEQFQAQGAGKPESDAPVAEAPKVKAPRAKKAKVA